MENKEQFLNECRQHVAGRPVTQMKRTRKFGKAGVAGIAILIVASLVVSATVLNIFGGYKQGVNGKVSIWVDGEKDGAIHDLGSVELFGGDVLTVDHTLENKGGHTITVYKADYINETIEGVPTPIQNDEITVAYKTYTTSAGQINMGTVGYLTAVRFDNQLDAQWNSVHQGADMIGSNAFAMLIIYDLDQSMPSLKIDWTESAGPHYYTWVTDHWSNGIAITMGSRDTDSGVLVDHTGNDFKISVTYEKLPSSFSWGYKITDNVPETLKYPTAWSGSDTSFTNLQQDGYIYSDLEFPIVLMPHTTLEYRVIYTTNPMIGENPYTVETIFTPN